MSLSGNKQKVSLAKCLVTDAKIIILDEAAKGIDVALRQLYTIMDGLANDGLAVIMISSELPGNSHYVRRDSSLCTRGKVKGFFNADEAGRKKYLPWH